MYCQRHINFQHENVEYYPVIQNLEGSLSLGQWRDGLSMEAPPDIVPERRSNAYTGETRQSGLEQYKRIRCQRSCNSRESQLTIIAIFCQLHIQNPCQLFTNTYNKRSTSLQLWLQFSISAVAYINTIGFFNKRQRHTRIGDSVAPRPQNP